jgi:hypothetical protein
MFLKKNLKVRVKRAEASIFDHLKQPINITYSSLLQGNIRPRQQGSVLAPRLSQISAYRSGMIHPLLVETPFGEFPPYCKQKVYRMLPKECRSTVVRMFFANTNL